MDKNAPGYLVTLKRLIAAGMSPANAAWHIRRSGGDSAEMQRNTRLAAELLKENGKFDTGKQT